MSLVRMSAAIARIEDLSPTAREVTLALPEPLAFLPGAFVNVFMDADGKKERRAYSISSAASGKEIALSIRKGSAGGISERFWRADIGRTPLTIMGPLGLNTADRIERPRVFLFAFGIGVSVVKALAEHLLARESLTELWIITGSRTEGDILYKEFFESLRDPRLHLRFVVSRPEDAAYPYRGYLQDHIADLDFADASVYICGQGSACETLKHAIAAKEPGAQFLIESFDG